MASVRSLSAPILHDAHVMEPVMKRLIVLSLTAFTLLSAGTLTAIADDDDERDHEIARKALSEGRIRPLTDIMDELKAQFPGQIIGVELEVKKTGAFVYEFKILTPQGKLKEVNVDAATAKILTIEDDD
ncbi:PepSY domain-containing protein [Hyphomicrobium sp. B1]|jgi:uncharacterized membrane protein YkoI|uniref:PepSY domain-containing protein n=1 Tax=unclassified Hyphomicrobium TaxID=2619925 RepID=UPI00391DC834